MFIDERRFRGFHDPREKNNQAEKTDSTYFLGG